MNRRAPHRINQISPTKTIVVISLSTVSGDSPVHFARLVSHVPFMNKDYHKIRKSVYAGYKYPGENEAVDGPLAAPDCRI